MIANFEETNHKTMDTSRFIAYIGGANTAENKFKVASFLDGISCESIMMEERKGKARPVWDSFIDALHSGDTAVLYSFDSVFRNFSDMMFFIKYCIESGVKMVSVHDQLDSYGEHFPQTKSIHALDLVCRIFKKRDKRAPDDLESALYAQTFKERKAKRYCMVINMYRAGYTPSAIMEKTGYQSKSCIYKILRQNGITLRYPAMSRAAKSDSQN